MARTIQQPPRTTVRALVGGLGALVVLAGGIVGIPLVLATTVGWPLPRHLPGGGQVAGALQTSIPDSFWPHLFASLAWLAWAYFVFSVASTALSHVRGRNRRARLAGHSAAAALVSAVITATIVLTQLRAAPTGRVSTVTPAVTAVVTSTASRTVTPSPLRETVIRDTVQLVSDTGVPVAAQPTTVTHTVVAGDTLWGIAATYYGNGEQWEAIYQANVGVLQPGGGMLTDAHWIYPGWTLKIPNLTPSAPVAPLAPPAAPVTSALPPVIHGPAGGNHHAAVQPDHGVGSPELHKAPSPQVHAELSPAQHSGRTGGSVKVPAEHGSATANHPGVAPQNPHDVHTLLHKPQGTHHDTSAPRSDDIGTIAIGAGIFGLAAIGLVGALDRRRRRQSARRAPGRRIPLPAPHSAAADLELALRHYARADALFWLSRLGDLLAYAADRAGTTRPAVLGVHVYAHGLDVFVAEGAGEAPEPFEGQPGQPGIWHLGVSVDSGVLDDTAVAEPVPLTFFSVGQSAEATLLVNLEEYHSVHINVDADQVPGTLAAIGTELAASSGSHERKVLAVRVGYGVIDRLDGGFVTDDLDTALTDIRSGEDTVVLVDAATASAQHPALSQAAGLHLITAGPVAPTGTGLVIDPATPNLAGPNLESVDPAHVDEATLADVDALLDLAEAPAEAGPTDEPYGDLNGALPSLEPQPGHPIVLGIVGEPTIALGENGARDLLEAVSGIAGTKARRVVELLVYLAAHDGSATRGEWLTDVSPDKALSDGYVRNLVLLTRRSLQDLTGDVDLLAYDRASQRFTLADRVRSDWTMFRALAADNAPDGLRSALSLVRGMPFGANPEPWTSAGGISYAMVAEIVDVALALAELALSGNDAPLATWAARQGQLVDRYDQGLWRMLLRSAGDNASRERIWQELCDLMAVDGDPAADLDPATVDLHNALNTPRQLSDVVVLQDEDDMVLPTRQAV